MVSLFGTVVYFTAKYKTGRNVFKKINEIFLKLNYATVVVEC